MQRVCQGRVGGGRLPRRRGRGRRGRAGHRFVGCLFVVPAIALGAMVWEELQRGSYWLGASVLVPVLVVLGLWLRGVLGRRRRARTLAELLQLTPAQFEQAIAELLRDLGY